jgi:type I restriction enzyme S subunit
MSSSTNYFDRIEIGKHITELPKSQLPASVATDNGKYPFICSSSKLKFTDVFIEEKPAVVLGTGGVASVHYGEKQFSFSTDTWAIRSNSCQLNTEYLFRKIQQLLPEINYRAFEGSGLKHLRKNDIKRLVINVPTDQAISNKLLSILKVTDRTIEKTEELIKKYQQIKTGLMQALFTRGIGPDGKLRPPREQAPELYHKTQIGWIPKEWEAISISKILINIDSGWSPSCIEITPTIGEWGVLKVSAVTKGFYDCNESKTLPSTLKPIPSLEVSNGDVIMTRANGVAELVGKTVQVKNTQDMLMLSDKLLRLVPNSALMTKNFLALMMSTNIIKSQIEKKMSGSSGQKNISQSEIRSFVIAKPKKSEQFLIYERLFAAENLIEKEKIYLTKLNDQKLGLMNDLLTGKKSVTVTETICV